MKSLVVGIGNPLRSDDGLGWKLVRSLPHICDMKAVHRQQPLPELVAELRQVKRAVFVDVSVADAPGAVATRRIHPFAHGGLRATHALSIPALLQGTRELYGDCPETYLVTVGGSSFGYGEHLSTDVEAALPELVRRVVDLVADEPARTQSGREESQ